MPSSDVQCEVPWAIGGAGVFPSGFMQYPVSSQVNKPVWSDPKVLTLYKASTTLYNPEILVFLRFRSHISGKVLDIGCGAGRTSFFLLQTSERYVGIDYSEEMIRACKARFPDANFRVCDFSKMAFAADAAFDFALFSFNGIDYVDHSTRIRGISEVHRILAKDGLFVFSSHNRNALPPRTAGPMLQFSPDPRRQLRLLKAFIAAWRNHQHNKKLETSAAEHVLINDHSHQFSLLTYYIGKKDQLEQLLRHGFDVIDIYDNMGRRLSSDADDSDSPWIYYVARKV